MADVDMASSSDGAQPNGLRADAVTTGAVGAGVGAVAGFMISPVLGAPIGSAIGVVVGGIIGAFNMRARR